MDVFHIATIGGLFFAGFHLNVFGSLLAIATVNAAVIGFCVVAYGVHKVRSYYAELNLQNIDKVRRIWETKELILKKSCFSSCMWLIWAPVARQSMFCHLACQKLCLASSWKEEVCHNDNSNNDDDDDKDNQNRNHNHNHSNNNNNNYI